MPYLIGAHRAVQVLVIAKAANNLLNHRVVPTHNPYDHGLIATLY